MTEYVDIELPWAKSIPFNKDGFPNLRELLDSDFSSCPAARPWRDGRVAARWFALQVTLEKIAGKILPVLRANKDDENTEDDFTELMVEWSNDSNDLPQDVRDALTDEELDLLRDFWEDCADDWDISGDPHSHSESLMVRTGAFRSTHQSMPETVGELVELLNKVPPETMLTCESGLRLERAGKFWVVDFAGEADLDNQEHSDFEDLAAAKM